MQPRAKAHRRVGWPHLLLAGPGRVKITRRKAAGSSDWPTYGLSLFQLDLACLLFLDQVGDQAGASGLQLPPVLQFTHQPLRKRVCRLACPAMRWGRQALLQNLQHMRISNRRLLCWSLSS
jgi:hypothetical protein